MIRRASKLVAAVTTLVLAASALTAINGVAPSASALSGSRFDPGLIISDSVFYDFGTMSVADIQRFLDSKVPTCKPEASPTCLRHYSMDVAEQKADMGRCAAVPAATAQTAAQIIFTVANACGINPRVLLVMLEKEQGLITSTNPSPYMYKAAMGYGCPDSNPAICGNVFSGLFNQIYHAAGQMRWYGNPKGSYTYLKPGKTISRPFNPKSYAVLDKNGNVITPAKCGFKSFVLQNQATANLYYYTPYTPNDAALQNLYSLGDACSAYGNRNFWRYYWDWFGSPIGGGFLLKSDSSDIYLVVNDTRYRVVDPSLVAALAALGPVGTISQAYLESFKMGQDLTRVFSSVTGQYFFVDDSKRFTFSDCNQVASLGLDCAKAVQLTNSQIAALAPGGAVTTYVSGPNGDSYLIQNGVRHEILDNASIADAGLTMPALSPVAADTFDNLPWGDPIAKDGSLVVNRDTANVGVISAGTYYEIDPSVSGIADFTKWFRKTTGSLSLGGVSTISSGRFITDFITGPNHDTYFIAAEGKRQITNPNEFIDQVDAAPVSQAFLNMLPIADSPITAPALVRSVSGKSTYLVRAGQRRLVENSAAANLIGLDIPSPAVSMMPAIALSAIPVASTQIAPGTLVAVKGKATQYLIDGLDHKLKVATPSIAAALGLPKTRIIDATTAATFSNRADISGLKVFCADKTLVAVDGVLHPIISAWAREYPGEIASLDASTCASLHRTSGQIGRFILTPDNQYWLVVATQKRLLTGKTQYKKLRGNGPAALKVSATFAGFFATGAAIKKSAASAFNIPATAPTPGPTSTPSPTSSATPKPTASPTPKPTPSPTTSPKPTPSPTLSPTPTPAVKKYTVVAGDTMKSIAQKFLPAGSSSATVAAKISAIAKANNLANVNLIRIGQVLTIP